MNLNHYKSLIHFIKRYNLESDVLKWAGSFRYLQAIQPNGFTVEKWIDLNLPVDVDIADSLFRIFAELNLIENNDGLFKILHEIDFQRTLEIIYTIVCVDSLIAKDSSKLLWTISNQQRSSVPNNIGDEFNYLYTWIQEIILMSKKKIIFFAPFFSESGIRKLLNSLYAINRNKSNMIIYFVLSDVTESNNAKAIEFLSKNIKMLNNNRIMIFEPGKKDNNKLGFHAKLLLVDDQRGYLGSANYSHVGLSSQFELGVPITAHQTKILTNLIEFWINEKNFILIKLIQ